MPSTVRVQLQLRIVSDDDTMIRDEVILQLDKSGDRLETIGLCLEDSKDLLGRLQHAVVEAQAARPTSTGIAAAPPAAAVYVARDSTRSSSAPCSAMFRSQARAFTAVAVRHSITSKARSAFRDE
jgi:hypothetical protein